jgi:aldose sugar dehydrogenase
MRRLICFAILALTACSAGGAAPETGAPPFSTTEMAKFDEPWALAFLPDGRALVTEKGGTLKLWQPKGKMIEVTGVPRPATGGQGGLGDVVLDPGFAQNGLVWLSWVEAGPKGSKGAVVGKARLVRSGEQAELQGLVILWRQSPKVSGSGHFGHRIAFGPDGMLYISSGERQKFTPAQDKAVNLGKIVRLRPDGGVPADNPMARAGGTGAQIWSMGHRNPLGLAFDSAGRLWEVEMGPQGGDELNLIEKGGNYGWPIASNGSHYDGRDIPDHTAGDGFAPPKLWWNPSISPGGLMVYSGKLFPAWKGDAFIAALGGEALIHIDLDGAKATKAEQWPMDARIRAVREGPDGALWLLEDGSGGRLLRLMPR